MRIAGSPAVLISLLLIAAGLDGCAALAAPRDLRVGLEPIAGGFTAPVALAAPDDGSRRLFVVDQVGVIWIVVDGMRLEPPFLDIRERVVILSAFYDERGLLGLAFHPDFAANGRFFVYYSAPLRAGLSPDEWDHTTTVAEFVVSAGDPNRADPTSERVVLAVDKPGYNYEAGHIAFGSDGYLYIAMGDSARHPDREVGGYAQDTSSLLGKILRIDVDGGDPYGIPPDNPFAGGGGRAEVFAYGLRNPYRFSFDAGGDRALIAADVGHAVMEEIDVITRGGNYGWPIREGTTCFNPEDWARPLERCAIAGARGDRLIDPVIAYSHGEGLSAVIGGVFYRGGRLPDLHGYYVFGDWGRGRGRLFAARRPEPGHASWRFEEIDLAYRDGQAQLGQLLGIGQDTDLELYVLVQDPRSGPTGESGRVYKIVPP